MEFLVIHPHLFECVRCQTIHAGRTMVFNLRKLETVRIRGGTPAPAVRAVGPDKVKEFCFFHISPLNSKTL